MIKSVDNNIILNYTHLVTTKGFVPKYRRLFSYYKDRILNRRLAPGDRVDSINEIQSRHAVSRETAKTVLIMLANEGLIIKKAGMGSFVAPKIKVKKDWALILPQYSAQYNELINILHMLADKKGRKLRHFLDYNNHEEEVRLVGEAVNEGYEAIIIVPTLDESKTAEFYSRLTPRDSFVTLLDHTMSGSFFSYVIQSYDLGVNRGLAYLTENTKGRTGFVRNTVWTGRNILEELMIETFLQSSSFNGTGAMIIDSVENINAAFLQEQGLDGLFCCDDTDAVRMIGRLKESGMEAKKDYRLVSYGNTELARYFTPSITSVNPQYSEMAATSVSIIMQHINNKSTANLQYVVQPSLIVRDT